MTGPKTTTLATMLEQRYSIVDEANIRQRHLGQYRPRPPIYSAYPDSKVLDVLLDEADLRCRLREANEVVKDLRRQASPAAMAKRHGIPTTDIIKILNSREIK